MYDSNTIAAVATAPGRGGVAVVRVSGPDAFHVAEKVSGRPVEPGRIAVRSFRLASGELADRGVLLAFAGPASYTGEDVVELQCHGGSVTPRRVLDACLAAGARIARRGEFTERAFLNGRMDISAAEAVIDLVDARTGRAADDALARLEGARTRANREIYDMALSLSVRLEHALDVDESDMTESYLEKIDGDFTALRAAVRKALSGAHGGRLLRQGALVVLAGPPNAGKSSLMNALLGEMRAIVSDMPGTTRDSIEEGLDIGGWPVRLVDTAGLRDCADGVEAEGVRRAGLLAARADIVLALDGPGFRHEPESCAERTISVHSKCDLGRGPGLNVSAKTGEGLDMLRAEIARRLDALAGDGGETGPAPGERELSLLEEALRHLGDGRFCDMAVAANAARAAADALGRLSGAVYSDDLLDALFSRFCVGK